MQNEICFLVTLLTEGELKRVSVVLGSDHISDDLIEYPMEPSSREELSTHLPTELQLAGKIVEVVEIWDVVDARNKTEKPQKHYLNKMQLELHAWDKKNFGKQDSYRSLLGVFEEVGELAHAHLKEEQGIRATDYEADAKDAIGDAIIYLANYCNARGFNLQDIIKETWDQVKERDWVKYPMTGRPEEKGKSPMSFKEFQKTAKQSYGAYITEYLPTFIRKERQALLEPEKHPPITQG